MDVMVFHLTNAEQIRKNDSGSDHPKRSRTRQDTDPQHWPILLTLSYLSYRRLFSISL
jgi:hypothetical protein